MPDRERAEIVIIGAGIAGVSAAYHLSLRGQADIVLVDEGPPLSLTSDKSTECYRNFWPGPDGAMTALMNRSIDLLESLCRETDNAIRMNRRGYLFVTQRPERVDQWLEEARQAESFGAGPVRVHEGSASAYARHSPDGLEAIGGVDMLPDACAFFPYLAPASSAMHIRRAGWLKSDLLGRLLLERAWQAGVRVIRGSVIAFELTAGAVSSVVIRAPDGSNTRVDCRIVVDAAGPKCGEVAAMAGQALPVFSELHLKVNFRDPRGAMPREAPLVIGDDPVELRWTEEEEEALANDPSTSFLTEVLPAGVHGRPEGGAGSDSALLLWTYDTNPVILMWPIEPPPHLAEAVVRGIATVLPAFKAYEGGFPKPILDGGYYTKTRENRPLIGHTSVPGLFLICALSGYGIMAAAAAGELLALSVLREDLPDYAKAFSPERYCDADYVSKLESWQDSSQL